jgi:hypothetical protein
MNLISRAVFGVSLFFVFSTAPLFGDSILDITFNVRPSWSGAWFNPDQPGHGISVEILDDERTIFFWYTYDLDGNPFWLIAQGENNQIRLWDLFLPYIRVEATAYYHEGMIFGEFDPATREQQEWGTIILDFLYLDCSTAHMEWYPTMEGFTQGSTDLVRLTSLSELDCVEPQDVAGNWEVQFGYDAELKYPVELVATPDPENPDQPDLLSFEFLDETDCLWSGEIEGGVVATFDFSKANWSNQCGATTVEHSGRGTLYFEHNLCNSENECTRKDEVMIIEDEGEYLIFSR